MTVQDPVELPAHPPDDQRRLGRQGADIAEHSGKLFGAILQLRRDLSLLDTDQQPSRQGANGNGAAVGS